MGEMLTIEEIGCLFPRNGSLIGDPRTDSNQKLMAGQVLFRSRDRDIVNISLSTISGIAKVA